jgi:WXG100 family type VII secretion target
MSTQGWGTVEIKVTPTVLKQKADDVRNRISNLSNLFSELETEINNTQSYWLGEAGELHRKAYSDQKSNLEEMIQRLKEHPVDLLQISGNYETAEQTIQESVAALQDNAIS